MFVLVCESGAQYVLTAAEVGNLLETATRYTVEYRYEQACLRVDGALVVCPRGSDWRGLLHAAGVWVTA